MANRRGANTQFGLEPVEVKPITSPPVSVGLGGGNERIPIGDTSKSIAATQLGIGRGNNVMFFDTTNGLYIGNQTFSSAPFRVALDGSLTATSATISGSITATGGTIGGFTISSTTLSATNLTLTSGAANTANISVGTGSNIAGMNSANASTDIAFWAGATHANRATANTSITAGGFITTASILINTTSYSGQIAGIRMGGTIVSGSDSGYGITFGTINAGSGTAWGISMLKVLNNTGTGYGFYQQYVNFTEGATQTGVSYGIYQGGIQHSETNEFNPPYDVITNINPGISYGLYQGVISNNFYNDASRNKAYGIYQSEVSESNYGFHCGYYIDVVHSGGVISSQGYSFPTSTIAYGIYINALETSSTSGVTAKFLSFNNAQSSTNIGSRSTNTAEILHSREGKHTTGTKADDFDIFYIKRTSIQNGAGGTFTSTGSVLKLENVATQTAGTLTDSTPILELTQDNNSTGGHILFTAYSGTPTTNNTLWYDGTNIKYINNAGVTKTITVT